MNSTLPPKNGNEAVKKAQKERRNIFSRHRSGDNFRSSTVASTRNNCSPVYPDFSTVQPDQRLTVTGNFRGKHDWDLSCKVGDNIVIIAKVNADWCFAQNIKNKKMGIIPHAVIFNGLNWFVDSSSLRRNTLPFIVGGRKRNPSSGGRNCVLDATFVENTSQLKNSPGSISGKNSEYGNTGKEPDYDSTESEIFFQNAGESGLVRFALARLENLVQRFNRFEDIFCLWIQVTKSYEATEDGQLSAVEGEILRWGEFTRDYIEQQDKKLDDIWILCENTEGKTGYFPGNHCHILGDYGYILRNLQKLPQAIVINDYVNESLQISIKAGDMVFISFTDGEYAKCFYLNGYSGFVPEFCIQRLSP